MIRSTLLAATVLAAAFAQHANAKSYNFKTIKDGKGLNTSMHGINDSGVGVGGVFDQGSTERPCFVLTGKVKTPLNDPKGVNGTECWGISSTGTIVGDYFDANTNQVGYIYSNGTFTDIMPPKATATVVYGVNASNVVTGYYITKSGEQIGFLYDGTTYTDIKIKGGSTTEGFGINDSGDYTVSTVLSDGYTHSYLVHNGTMTEIIFPKMVQVAAHQLTNKGLVVATVISAKNVYYAGVFDSKKQTYVKVADPDGTTTIGDGINDQHEIAGRFIDSSNNSYGYIATGK
ncbi:MAG TPA: hypothetical protein VMB71_08570 [Acetobacteraceae bacterium]|nr:hypothetical protein [Acetobacteraceae bacterium]